MVFNLISVEPGTIEICAGDVALLVISGSSVLRRSHYPRQRNLARRPKRKPQRRLQRLRLLVRQRNRLLFTRQVLVLPVYQCQIVSWLTEQSRLAIHSNRVVPHQSRLEESLRWIWRKRSWIRTEICDWLVLSCYFFYCFPIHFPYFKYDRKKEFTGDMAMFLSGVQVFSIILCEYH